MRTSSSMYDRANKHTKSLRDAILKTKDPAQSVVEGVDFRFEDVRSIVFALSAGSENI